MNDVAAAPAVDAVNPGTLRLMAVVALWLRADKARSKR